MSPRIALAGASCAVVLLVVGVQLIPSSSPGPLEALQQRSAVEQYGMPFWGKKRRTDPELWEAAKRFCADRAASEYPNCAPVLGWMANDRAAAGGHSQSQGIDPSLEWGAREPNARERLDRLTAPGGHAPQGNEQR